MFGALKRSRFRSLASLILVVNVNVGELQRKRTLATSRGFLAAARLSYYYYCYHRYHVYGEIKILKSRISRANLLAYVTTALGLV